MTRLEAIRLIVWALLAHSDTPNEAVTMAMVLRDELGPRARLDFRSLLRAAGAFAFGDDSYFIRYVVDGEMVPKTGTFPQPPPATHVLTVPVPVEPRMRIAYSVFTGLLLKYLYQRYGLIPLEVREGMATLWAPRRLSPAKPALPDRDAAIWNEFQESELASDAFCDGVSATFAALKGGRAIGAIELPHSWKGTAKETVLEGEVDKAPRLFQKQSTERLSFANRSRGEHATLPFRLQSLAICGCEGEAVPLNGKTRCLVCGQFGDFIQGGKFFLPENKKQSYEDPGPRDKFPHLCSVCAYIALLSGICPSSDLSIVEFPVDNFIELFALHERLQGISALVALKKLSRVASISVFAGRYLLLSRTTTKGKMDSKTQIYAQLRNYAPLLRDLARPMRVQVEGSQPNFWSEIYPHIAIGLSYFSRFPGPFETGAGKILAQRVTRAIAEGRPFKAVYLIVEARKPDAGFLPEAQVFSLGLRAYEKDFVRNKAYAPHLARSLGGLGMDCGFYSEVIDFSNFLLDVIRPLVQREVAKSRSSVSGVARKYTTSISRDFGECRAAKFLYAISQEADSAERDGDGWVKRKCFAGLYGGVPELEGKSGEEAAAAWADFREKHRETLLEEKLRNFHGALGSNVGVWAKFLGEVQARTLALLMLNIRNQ
jgi:hypothetical protein